MSASSRGEPGRLGGRDLWILGGLIVVAGAVRFFALGHQSFDHDEAVTAARVIHPSLWDTLHVVSRGERSPPLYYVLAWAWSKPFGLSEPGLRSLSALIGTATVLAAYWAARAFAGRRAGLIAAALFALNPYLIWYSQEARSYALLALMVTLGLGCLIRALDEPSRRNLALWALAALGAMLSHYFALFLIAPQIVVLLLRQEHRRRAFVAVLAVVACGAALLPLVISQEGTDRRNGFTETSVLSRSGETLLNFVAGEEPAPFAGRSAVDAIQILAAIAGLALLAYCAWVLIQPSSSRALARVRPLLSVFGFAFGVPILLAFAGLDFLNPRNLIGALVPLLLIAAVALAARLPQRMPRGATAAVLALFAFVVAATYASGQMQRPNFRSAAQAIEPLSSQEPIVVNLNADDPLRYYLGTSKLDHGSYPKGVLTRRVSAISTTFRVQAPPGFHEVDRGTAGGVFLIWRFEAPRPRRLNEADLSQVLGERSAPLVVSPGSG